MKRGGPLRRKTPLKRTGFTAKARKPLPAVSARRKREQQQRAEVRRVVLERDRGCVARRYGITTPCAGPLDVNELVRRGRWRAGYLDPDNCVALCRKHHDWVTVNIAAAKALGLDLSAPPVNTGIARDGYPGNG